MKFKFVFTLALLLSVLFLGAQDFMPKPSEIPKEYRSEYKKESRIADKILKESDAEIQLPKMEIVPIEKMNPSEFSSSDFSNWGKTVVSPESVIDKIVRASQYEVFFDCYDTGIDEDHPDMQVGKVTSRDGVNEKGGDKNGHGSHVWSTVMGKRGGVMYRLAEKGLLKGRATKVLNGNGSGSFSTYASMHGTGFRDDYKEIVDNGGFVVTNSSLGANRGKINYVESALQEGYEYGGITHVAAAGNSNSDVDYPASSPYMISVGAVDRNLKRAPFSCYGENLNTCAPGVGITACWKDGNYSTISGTSMSSPFVSAWCIAAYAVHGTKLKESGKMASYLSAIVRDIGDEGFDNYYGFGLAVLDRIPDTDPDKAIKPSPEPDPDPDPEPDPPVGFKSEVTFPVSDLVFRYKRNSDSKYRLMQVDDLYATIKCTCTEEQAYDLAERTIKSYFDRTALIIGDGSKFGHKTTAWWIGQFLEYQAKQKEVDLQVTSLVGTTEKGRKAYVTNFNKAGFRSAQGGAILITLD